MTISIGTFNPIPSVAVTITKNLTSFEPTLLPAGRLEISNPFTARHEHYHLFVTTDHAQEDRINYSLLRHLIRRGTITAIMDHWDANYADPETGPSAKALSEDIGIDILVQDFAFMAQELKGYPHRSFFKVSPGLWIEQRFEAEADEPYLNNATALLEQSPEDRYLRPVTLEGLSFDKLFSSNEEFIERVMDAWGRVTTTDHPFTVTILNGKRL